MKKGQRKKVCKYGHPLTGSNLRVISRKRKGQVYIEHVCKQCQSDRHAEEVSDE